MLLSLIPAWIGVLCVLTASCRYFARISRSAALNRVFHNLHIPAGIVLVLTGLLHGLMAGNFAGTSFADVHIGTVFFSFNWGTACFLAAILTGITYVLRKVLKKKWMVVHRFSTILLLCLLLIHILDVGIQLPSRILNTGNTASYDQETTDADTSKSPSFSGAQLKDGVYEGSAQGYEGTITVSVTVENGVVAKIDILKNNDTPEYFEHARLITDQIIGQQSLDVDAISGATFSSAGIKNAVANALESAVTDGKLDHSETDLPSNPHRGHGDGKGKNRGGHKINPTVF